MLPRRQDTTLKLAIKGKRRKEFWLAAKEKGREEKRFFFCLVSGWSLSGRKRGRRASTWVVLSSLRKGGLSLVFFYLKIGLREEEKLVFLSLVSLANKSRNLL